MAEKPFSAGHLLTAADVNDLVGVIDRQTTAVDLVSSAGEETLYNPSLGAGVMGTDRIVRVTIIGDYLNNNAAATLQFKLKFTGSLPMLDDVTGSISTSANRRAFKIVAEVMNIASASVQVCSLHVVLGAGDANSTGVGDLTTPVPIHGVMLGAGTDNTALAKTLAVTVQHNASSANQSIRRKAAWTELL